MRPTRLTAIALTLALPLASHALNICTDANGKSSFQDKPCETREAAPQFNPVKAGSVTEAGALETMNRLTGAMGARDVVALQRLLARDFESHLTLKREGPVVLNRVQFGQFFTRALQAAKSYRIQRNCTRDVSVDKPGVVALRCSYTDHIEVLNRSVDSRGDEFARIGVENGELKIFELSEGRPAGATPEKTAQASR